MAIDPKARSITASYPGGTVTGTLGLIEFLFGPQQTQWIAISGEAPAPGTRRKRKYGTRQRSSAAGGEPLYLRIADGTVWAVRITGADMDFIDQVLTKTEPGAVLSAWTDRGTIYGPGFAELE